MSLNLRVKLSDVKKRIFNLCNQSDFEAACSYNSAIFNGYTQKQLYRYTRHMTKRQKKEFEEKSVYKLIIDDTPPASASKEELVEYLTNTFVKFAAISLVAKAKANGEKYNKNNFTNDMLKLNTRLLATLSEFFEKK